MTATVVNFVLLREGTSDDGLIPHLRHLIVRAGASEAIGTPRPFTGTVERKLRSLSAESDLPDLVLVHRDADSASADQRHAEVAAAVVATSIAIPVIAVVPVQELEAWLLIDEAVIRSVVGRPNGRAQLGLPRLAALESTARPKELLQDACLTASEKTGRRLDKERRLFGQRRRALLERLDPDGPVVGLPAWQRLRKDVEDAVTGLVLAPARS